jgi:hypothetical protein
MSTAHEHVRVARGIEGLPLVREGFGSGELSYSKVRALTRVATPDTETDLVELARALTASQLDRTVAGYAKAQRNAEPQPEIERRLTWEWNDDGSLTGRFHVGADEGQVFVAAVQRQVEAERQAQREEAQARGIPAGDDRPLPEARADALLAVARMALAAEANTADVIVLPELLVHVEAEADGTVAAQIDDGPNLHPAAAQRLGCDASIQTMIERDGDALHVGRRPARSAGGCVEPFFGRPAGSVPFPAAPAGPGTSTTSSTGSTTGAPTSRTWPRCVGGITTPSTRVAGPCDAPRPVTPRTSRGRHPAAPTYAR